MELPGSAI